MKPALIVVLLFLMLMNAFAQPKTRGRVKRKYRDVERVSENLPQVIFRGMVRDINKNPLPGACIEIEGIKRLVHSNEFGKFMLSDLPTGRLRLKISCIGYRTKTIDYALKAGFNDHYLALDQEKIHLETLVAETQKRQQQINDIPAVVSVLNESFAEQLSIIGYQDLAEFSTRLNFEDLGAGKTALVRQGSIGNIAFAGVSSSVAVIADGVPLINPGVFSHLFLDLDRMEVLSGPQNTLFGKDAMNGAVHFISKNPDNKVGGYVTVGVGNFSTKETYAAINMPLVKDKLFIRMAGLFSGHDGFVENTEGGNLNGGDSYGGRFKISFIPNISHKINITMNYMKDESSGVAFMNPWIQSIDAINGLEGYRIALNRGNELGSDHKSIDAALTYKYFLNEHDFWTLISSYRKIKASDQWDADGTVLSALEMNDESNAGILYQEIRYNFSRKSRSNGSFGISYQNETGKKWLAFESNDLLIYEILNSTGNFLMPSENRFPFNPQPLNPMPMSDITLTGFHQEETINEHITQSFQAYYHLTYQLRQRIFFNGGVRAFYDRLQLSQQSVFTEGDESGLGSFSNSSPNLLFLPSDLEQLQNNTLSVTGQAGFTYRRNENFNFFVTVARGRKPQVLLFTWDSNPYVVAPENVNSAEAGWKAIVKQKVFWDVTGFYRQHNKVQTIRWANAKDAGLLTANGKATSFGAESNLKVALVKEVELFGNYSWMQSAFDSTGVDGTDYLYAGKSFAQAPEHSFSAGLIAKTTFMNGLRLFISPWYSWKSHFWFTESNTSGLDQPAFGLLNITTCLEMDNPNVVLSIYGKNLFETKYISSAGHWGGVFGMPTMVPGAPRRVGVKITWNF